MKGLSIATHTSLCLFALLLASFFLFENTQAVTVRNTLLLLALGVLIAAGSLRGNLRPAIPLKSGDDQDQVHRAYVECVGSLASALDARDCYTAGHSRRVSEYSCAVARQLGLDVEQEDQLRIGALLHDIGKIGVPDSVLGKPGRLTTDEIRLIQKHPAIGRRILEGVHGFAPYLSTVELHHENWDGTGYPYGLTGEETPLAARIVHVADAYDAMTSDRPYRNGMNSQDAVRILEENAGTQFDPAVVAVFASLTRTGAIQPEPELHHSSSLRRLAQSVARESSEVARESSEVERPVA